MMIKSESTKVSVPFLAAAACLVLLAGFGHEIALGQSADNEGRLEVLFLGDDGHHQPAMRLREILPEMAERGIFITYTERMDDLRPENLSRFDVLMIYGNKPYLSHAQEQAMLDFVAQGHGLVAVHSASACFANSDAYVNLIGGAFKSHGEGTFRTRILRPDHPVMEGVPNFESWDETYVHMKHGPDKTVLSVREEDGREEPWTWVRTHGNGRVFYTAWGHDERTWTNTGFHDLLERATRWSAGDWALEAHLAPPVLAYRTSEEVLPNYPSGLGWGITGEPITELQEPLRPEESMRHMAVEPGFRVELYAADPDIVNPIDMTWDAEGRLWIVETLDYPNQFEENRTGRDRVKVLEDTDGDGRADEFTVFAEGLNIPTSLAASRDGIVVSQAPYILYFRDTDGDDLADVRDTLITGFGTFDTHAGPSNLLYGYDNHIWGAVGYSGFNGAVGGDSMRFTQGFFRFTPGGTDLEYMATTNNNTWGLGFTEDGSVVGSTANRNPAVHMAVPNRFYAGVRGWERPVLGTIATASRFYPITDHVRQVDQHGRYTSGAGFHLYTARGFPKEYWNRIAFVGGPTGHLLGKFVLEPEGSSYIAHNDWNMLASRDEWFAPIQAKVGPDGALWVIDWYDLVIQHNPTPEGFETGEGNAYETPLRDQQHSRIYRIVHEDAQHETDYTLANAAPGDLVRALREDNLFWRMTAQRLLVERGDADVLPDLYELVRDETTDEIGLNPGALHALWTMHGLGALDGTNAEAQSVAAGALHHPAPGVRRAALMVLPRTEESRDAVLAAGIFPDLTAPAQEGYTVPLSIMDSSDPKVKLDALLALAEMPPSELAAEAAANLMRIPDNARDRWIADAATAAGAQHGAAFVANLLGTQVPDPEDTTFVRRVSGTLQTVAGHLAAGDEADELVLVLPDLAEADSAFGGAVLRGMAAGWPEGKVPNLTASDRERLRAVDAGLTPEQASVLRALAIKWGDPTFFTGTN